MKLTHQATAESAGFKVVCDHCGGLSIRFVDSADASETVIKCGVCDAARGSLADLRKLALRGKDVFEF